MKHLGTREIETQRLNLRRFTLEDADAMYRNWANDPEVTKYLTWPVHDSVEVTKQILTDWIASYDKEDTYQWCIAVKESDEPIGSIGVVGGRENVGAYEIGYCISRAYWHQGITSEALAAVMRYLLDEVGVNRIQSRHDPKNPYSGAVMRKCGLMYEGTRIQADWNNTGICDCALYGYVKGVTDQMSKDSAMARHSDRDEHFPTDFAEESVQAAADIMTDDMAMNSKDDGKMSKNVISDETIEYVGILAKLELSSEEKEQAKKDMGEMLDYIDKLNELDTEGVEPMSHVFPVCNVFREDVVANRDGCAQTLANAPEQKDGGFKVPKTIG